MTREILVTNWETGEEIARCTLADFFARYPEKFARARDLKNSIRRKLSRGQPETVTITALLTVRLSVSRSQNFPPQPNPENN